MCVCVCVCTHFFLSAQQLAFEVCLFILDISLLYLEELELFLQGLRSCSIRGSSVWEVASYFQVGVEVNSRFTSVSDRANALINRSSSGGGSRNSSRRHGRNNLQSYE